MLDFKYIIQESMRNKKKIDGIHPYAKATGLSAVLHRKYYARYYKKHRERYHKYYMDRKNLKKEFFKAGNIISPCIY